jgi:hypothetical protein
MRIQLGCATITINGQDIPVGDLTLTEVDGEVGFVPEEPHAPGVYSVEPATMTARLVDDTCRCLYGAQQASPFGVCSTCGEHVR